MNQVQTEAPKKNKKAQQAAISQGMPPEEHEGPDAAVKAEPKDPTFIYVFYQEVIKGGPGQAAQLGDKGLADFKSKADFDTWLESNPSIEVLRVIRGWEKQVKVQTKMTFL